MTTMSETTTHPVEPDQEHPTPETDGAEATEKRVPVSESIRYRRRAQQAEQKLAELQSQLAESRDELTEVRQTLDEVERRGRIDALLVESDVIDLEAARLLTEASLTQMDDADVTDVVDDLRRHKPYLFRRRENEGAMSPRPRAAEGGAADEAAAAAMASGHRRDLLRYLRLRRAH